MPETQTGAPPNGAVKDKPRVALRPFRTGVQPTTDEPWERTVTLTAATQNLDQYPVPATAYLCNIYILAECTVTANTATATGTGAVGVLAEDAPYILFDTITFTDTGNTAILGPITGYDLYVINKFGCYAFEDDPEFNADLFTATTNATASSSAAGSFSFLFKIPVEFVRRDALGSLPNKSNSTPFKVKSTISAISAIYINSATPGGSVRIRMMPESYWQPTGDDGSGNPVDERPPAMNTTQYWDVTPYEITTTLQEDLRNSVGYPVRMLIFGLEAAGVRSTGETDFPDDFTLQLQATKIIDTLPKKFWKKFVTEQYRLGIAGDATGQKDNGIYPWPFCVDFGRGPGAETRRGYLRTTPGMRLKAKGSVGGSGAHTWKVWTNYIGVARGATLASITT